MGKLDGKVALVTGASRGIGQGIAELFAREGARVVCAARTLHEGDHMLDGSLDRTVGRIREFGGDAIAVTADVSSEDDCNRIVEEAKAAFLRERPDVPREALDDFIFWMGWVRALGDDTRWIETPCTDFWPAMKK